MDRPLDGFECPLSKQIMRDPVIALDGYSYERAVISTWFRNNKRAADPSAPLRPDGSSNYTFLSPITNLPLQTDLLISNHALKQAIECWQGRLAVGGGSSSSGYVPGYVVGIPSQNQQAMTAYPSLVDGTIIFLMENGNHDIFIGENS